MWWWLACASPMPEPDPIDSVPQPTADTGVPASPPPVFVAEPEVGADPGPAWLVGLLTAETDRPTTLEITVDDGTRTWTQKSDEATRHEVRVLGLRPDATHTVTVTASADGQAIARTLSLETQGLPDWPEVTVTSDRSRMEPGVTLTEVGPYIAMLDAEGVPRWALRDVAQVHEVAVTPRGTLLIVSGRTSILEVDLAGNTVASWRAARTTNEPQNAVAVDVEALHHDVHELPNGNLLALSIERRRFPDYPTSERDPDAPRAPAWVAGDVVVELSRDGELVNAWPLLDRIDPYRIAYNGIVGDYWEAFYGGDDVKDWSHANAIWYDAARDEILVSLRHQDAMVALDHATGAVTWIVAPEANWGDPWRQRLLRPAVPALEPYHQHSAKITPDGRLMLFDNGNTRASPFDARLPDEQNTSRGLELSLDHVAGTWLPTFELETSPPLFSGSQGDCDPLPRTGNVLVTFGNVKDPDQDAVQILEATRDDPPRVVFELRLPQPLSAFRAQRVTGVLPVD